MPNNNNEPAITKNDVLALMPCDNTDTKHRARVGGNEDSMFVLTEEGAKEKAIIELGCSTCQFAGRICKALAHIHQRSADGTSVEVIATPHMDFEKAIQYLTELRNK